ncbi:serine hydrolase domain-containing protein [Flagellimonas allohymeniacidonis]|uniref:Serine hydrolase n=1 Tax=Flagellimonas allohymeniacidonis TaxID=2517819 RepID=A0A4Q8QGW3_9FLAO|nr:serine hydrolase domain-containing protein [Allomuricauda hymeniacidonis]TAI47843.1 serine hydrolase [Allomuricauda hymeniacidonis]
MNKFLTAILLFIAINCNAQKKTTLSDSTFKKLDNYFKAHFENGDFSGVVLIANNDVELYEKTIGFRSFEDGQRLKSNNQFMVGSISKSICAAAIVKLVQDGKLNFDDDVNNYASIFSDKKVTIKQLLRHTSGVPRFDKISPGTKLVDQINSLKGKEFLFEPGTDDAYSNEGYSILAYLVEVITQQPYNEFIENTFFDKLKMEYSGVYPYDIPKKVALGHRVTPSGPMEVSENVYHSLIGSGSNYSTAQDLLKWAKSISSNEVINLDSLEYPYGWGVQENFGNKIISQSGLVNGFTSYVSIYPEQNLYVIFVSNISSGFFNIAPKDISAILLDKDYAEPEKLDDKSLSVNEMEAYVGNYETLSKYPFGIYLIENGLYIKWNHEGDGILLTPTEKDVFVNRSDFTKNEFYRNEDNEISGFKISIKDQVVECKKLE